MFQAVLKEVVEGTEGGIATLLMDFEGIAVDSYSKPGAAFDITTIGAEFSVVLKSIQRAAQMLEAGRHRRGRHPGGEGDHPHPRRERHVLRRLLDDARRQHRQGALPAAHRACRRCSRSSTLEPRRAGAARPRRLGPEPRPAGHARAAIYGTATLADIHAPSRRPRAPRRRRVDVPAVEPRGRARDVRSAAPATTASHGIVLNAGAYTHTSIALSTRSARARCPTVEVHLSNPDAREAVPPALAHRAACLGAVAGFGAGSYVLGLRRACSSATRVASATLARARRDAMSVDHAAVALVESAAQTLPMADRSDHEHRPQAAPARCSASSKSAT